MEQGIQTDGVRRELDWPLKAGRDGRGAGFHAVFTGFFSVTGFAVRGFQVADRVGTRQGGDELGAIMQGESILEC